MNSDSQRGKARNFLKSHDVAVIATASESGQPHASAINYLSDEWCNLFFLVREHTQKYENLMRNPSAWVIVSDPHYVSTVEVRGPAIKIDNEARINRLLSEFSRAIQGKSPWPLPIMRRHGSEAHLFELKPEHIVYADFRPTHNHGHEGEYFEIEVVRD